MGCSNLKAAPPDSFQGVIELDERVLGFELPGKVNTVLVSRGMAVVARQELATLDRTLEETVRSARVSDAAAATAQLALLKAGSRAEAILSVDAQVRAARATEELLKKNLERERVLRAQGAATDAQLDEVEGRLGSATGERQAYEQRAAELRRGSRTEELSAATARIDAANAAVRLEDERLARHSLSAPDQGLVVDVHVKTGEVVSSGTPVVTIADPKHPYADVFVPQGRLGAIKPGVNAEVRVDGEPGAFQGKVEMISPKTEFTPRYLFSDRERPNLVVRVRVRIADPGEKLHAGVPAFAVFPAGARK